MDTSHVADNARARDRLVALLGRLTDDDMSRSIGHGWTVNAALAHLAFWDRKRLAELDEWEQGGVQSVPVPHYGDQLNDAMLPEWRNASPAEVRREVVAAAEALDRKIEFYPADLAEAIVAQRPRSLIRAIHRHEHLDEIERALVGH